MPVSDRPKKVVELRALAAARRAGVPIPEGEIPGERPDFKFETEVGILGVEVSELLRPASRDGGIVPAAAATYHRQVVEMAEARYYSAASARHARVIVYFSDSTDKRRDRREMAKALSDFVAANVQRANPVVGFGRRELPDGFGSMSIVSESGKWSCGESGAITLSDIRRALGRAIGDKDKLVRTYRERLGLAARVWLLLYTTADVSRSMPIPHGIDEWRFRFGFDRVFWFVCLENQFVEIRRMESAASPYRV